MGYLPDLIPKEHKVLQEHFKKKGAANKHTTSPTRSVNIAYGFTVFFSVIALANLFRPWLFLLFAVLVFIALPFGQRRLEQWLSFKLKLPIAIGIYTFLMCCSIPLFSSYRTMEAEVIEMARIKAIKEAEEKAVIAAKENARKDSLELYIREVKNSSTPKARRLLAIAEKWVSEERERQDFKALERKVIYDNGLSLFKKADYRSAEKEFNLLLDKGYDDGEIYYRRANCNYKLRRIADAVADLSIASSRGYSSANSMYNQINPIRRKVSYYVTRCCDGSTSNATGRGACSWHGGVCNWNEAVYEEYRKY